MALAGRTLGNDGVLGSVVGCVHEVSRINLDLKETFNLRCWEKEQFKKAQSGRTDNLTM